MEKLRQRISNFFKGLLRPFRNRHLSKFMDKPVVLFTGKTDREEGGIYIARDYSGLDNSLLLFPLEDDADSSHTVPVWAKPNEVYLYSLEPTEKFKLLGMNLYSYTIGRV